MNTTALGNTDLQVSRLGVGAMAWGDPSGLARLTPAKLAYGGAHGFRCAISDRSSWRHGYVARVQAACAA